MPIQSSHQTRPKLSRKVKEWARRYLPAEVVATATAIGGAFLGRHLSGSLAVAAIAGTIGENIGYYGYFVIHEGIRHYGGHRQIPLLRRWVVVLTKTHRDMLVEFGPAEVLDSFFVRPTCMYLGPRILGSFAWGILAGKLAADVVFYSFAIIGYEIRKRWLGA